jgi:hypothetical protein
MMEILLNIENNPLKNLLNQKIIRGNLGAILVLLENV